jgi:hypothetical protein
MRAATARQRVHSTAVSYRVAPSRCIRGTTLFLPAGFPWLLSLTVGGASLRDRPTVGVDSLAPCSGPGRLATFPRSVTPGLRQMDGISVETTRGSVEIRARGAACYGRLGPPLRLIRCIHA